MHERLDVVQSNVETLKLHIDSAVIALFISINLNYDGRSIS